MNCLARPMSASDQIGLLGQCKSFQGDSSDEWLLQIYRPAQLARPELDLELPGMPQDGQD